MPGPVEIGTAAGMAAPGELSPSALLTTRGDTIVRDSTGAPVRLALGTVGKVLRSDGTDLGYAYPPGHLILHDAGATLTNPTSATTLLAGGAVSNLWPTYVAAGDAIDVFACGTHNLVSSSTMTLTVLFGSTTVATIGPATATTALRPWWINLRFIMLSSTSVLPTGQAVLRGPSSASSFGVAVPAIGDIFTSDMIAVTVTAAPQTFDLKGIIGTGNASSVITCKTVQVRHIPRDY